MIVLAGSASLTWFRTLQAPGNGEDWSVSLLPRTHVGCETRRKRVPRVLRGLRAVARHVRVMSWGAFLFAFLGFVLVARAATPLPEPSALQTVYDQAEVIPPAQEHTMEQLNRELFEKSEVALVVVTVPVLEDETIAEFAVRVGQTWGVGIEGRDRGLVIAFSRDDRKIFVATGYGTEGYLPDGRVGALLDEHVIPHLARNAFGEGLERANAVFAAASAEEYGITLAGQVQVSPPAPQGRRELGLVEIVLGGLFLLLVLYVAIRHPRMFMFALLMMMRGGSGGGGFGGGGFGGGGGRSGFGGGGFGGGGAGRGF